MNWRSRSLDRVMKNGPNAWTRRLFPVLFAGIIVAAGAQTVPACSSSSAPANAGPGSTGPAPTSTSPTPTPNACDHPSPGCACATAGVTAPCGTVITRSGNFFQCSEGTTTCDGATWGACDGSIKLAGTTFSGGGVSIRGLGNPSMCGSTNPCDPYCSVLSDTPAGIDGGPGIAVIDGGLTIAPPSGVHLCNLATTPATLQASAAGGNPGSCTAGASDNCNYDNYCATTGGACAAYPDGHTNTTGTCVLEPDFTLGTGCWDASASTGLELQVCNRGGVIANTGSLTVALSSGPPALAAGTCPAGSKAPTTTLTAAATNGKCTIALASFPLGPGECTSFNVTTPPTGITCTSTAGGAIALTGPTVWAMVNPPTGVLAGTTQITECDPCNNYTAVAMSSQPTGTPPTGAGACVSSWCGVSGTVTTTAGCPAGSPTEITGQVMDPAMNVGLSNVAVYIATGPTITIPPEPGGTTPPTCDSCAGLSSPGYASGVSTDVNGKFTLYTNPGTYAVVAQLGRWRRIVTNVVVQNCQNTAIANDSIRMPKTSAEGDIPKMAIVEGGQETLACWLAKVGIATSEIAPFTATTTTNRIDLYNSDSAGASGAGLSYWSTTSGSAVVPPNATVLWGSTTTNTLNNYSSVIVPCDGQQTWSLSTTEQAAIHTALEAYANAGGRVFMDHLPGNTLIGNDPVWGVAAVGTWVSNQSASGGTVLNTSADQQAMHSWLSVWDTADPAGTLTATAGKGDAVSVGADSTELVSFSSPASVASFWFNTPITATAGSYCGRVVFNDMHVSAARSSSNSGGTSQTTTFPTSCTTGALTPEELALEYEMFQLSACALGVAQPIAPPPPPPPPAPLGPTTFTRVFQAVCPAGFIVKWGFFEWQDVFPAGTGMSINFTAATSANGTTWGPTVPLGTSTASTGAVYSASPSVDTLLTTATPPQSSLAYLEVNMTLTPDSTGTVAPYITSWQQLYDCLP